MLSSSPGRNRLSLKTARHKAVVPSILSASSVLAGSVAVGAIQWFAILALGRFSSPAEIGLLSIAYAVGAPFQMAANGQLRQVLASDTGTHGLQFGDYFAFRAVGAGLAAVATLVCGTLAGFSATGILTIGLVAVAKSTESLSDIFYGLYQASGDTRRMGRSMLLRGLIGILVVVGCASVIGTALGVATGLATASLAVFICVDFRRARASLQRVVALEYRSALAGPTVVWRPAALRVLLRVAAPLGLSAGLGALTWNLPRYFLQQFRGAYELGLFSGLTALPLALATLPGTVAQVMAPLLAETRARGDGRTLRAMVLLASTGAALTAALPALVALPMGESILAVTLGPRFSGLGRLLSVAFLLSAPQYALFFANVAFVASNRYHAQLAALLPSLAIGAALGLLFVPRYGLAAAIYVSGVTSAAQLGVSAWQSRGPIHRLLCGRRAEDLRS